MAGHDRITADGKKLFKQLEDLKKLQVRVGYQQDAGKDEDGVDLLDIAIWNELGTVHIPSRPFLRQSADMNKSMIEDFCKAQLQTVTKGGTAEQILNAIGSMQKGLVQDTISKSKDWAEPNALSTIWKKSKKALKVKRDDSGNPIKFKNGKSVKRLAITKLSDQPLVDTGRLKQSVNYVVVPKGGG